MKSIRDQFPICKQKFPILGGKEELPLIYLDHGASTHPPLRVIETLKEFVEKYYSNIHRGNHNLSLIATDMFDQVQEVILDFIGADPDTNTAVLTQNTTGALDMAAYLMSGVEGVTLSTVMEHHSNFLPHKRRGETLLVKCLEDGSLDMKDLQQKLEKYPVKLVAVTGASNVTGFMPDVHRIAQLAHEAGARILVDAAQLLAHNVIDVRPDDDPGHIDFLAAAGHKAYAPFGSAFLFGPREIFDQVDPYVPGGGTVEFVTPETSIWTTSPDRHQGGTPNIPGAIAMAEALKFLKEVGLSSIRDHEKKLYEYTISQLREIEGVNVFGPADPQRCIGVISFNVGDLPNELVAAILNYEAAIATRNGCFCAHPYIQHLLGVQKPLECKMKFDRNEITFMPGAVRATIGIYNTLDEMKKLIEMVKLIAQRQWQGEYHLTPTSMCQPIRFTVGEGAGQASCIGDELVVKPGEELAECVGGS